MRKSSQLQSDFSAGELTPLIWGRVESEVYRKGVETMLNNIVTLQGPPIRRPGFTFVTEGRDSSRKFLLVNFEFSTIQSYVLEFSHLKLRFLKNGGLITLTPVNITGATQANPAVVTANAHGYSNGDRVVITSVGGMIELNGREFEVAGVTANTFQLKDPQTGANVNSTAFGAYTAGGQVAKVYEVATPYEEQHLDGLRWVQSADLLFVVSPAHVPYEITRSAHTSWTVTAVAFEDGPYGPENETGATLAVVATGPIGGTTNVNAVPGFITTDWVGRCVRLRHGNTIGWGIVTSVLGSATFVIVIMAAFANTNPTTGWRQGVIASTTGFPTVIEFHQGRLVMGGYITDVTREDFSFSGDLRNFSPTDIANVVTDAHAISGNVASRGVNKIQAAATDPKGLVDFTLDGEYLAHPNTNTTLLTPTDTTVDRYGSWGSANHIPVRAGRSVIFIQRSGKMLRETTFFLDSDGFQSTDISLVANHLAKRGIKSMAFARMPFPVLWCVCNDGSLVGVTFERDATGIRYGWHQHQLGGVSNAGGDPPVVETLTVIPSPDGTYDELWIGARRWNAALARNVRSVERLHKFFEETDPEYSQYFVDCGLSLETPLTITGATKANPVVLTITGHGLSNGDTVFVAGVRGMTQLNNRIFKVANKTANTIELNTTSDATVNGEQYSTYASGGVAARRVTELSGLYHLAGETVDVLGDGVYQRKTVTSTGKLTLGVAAGFVHVGLKITARLKTLPEFNALPELGFHFARRTRPYRLGLKVFRSQRVRYGRTFEKMFDAIPRTEQGLPLFTGVVPLSIEGDPELDSQLCFEQSEPFAGTFLAITADSEVSANK